MGVKTKSRLFAVVLALVMIMTSAMGVFANTASSEQGSSNANKSSCSVAKGTITVSTDGEILKTSKGKISSDGKTITGLKEGQKVVITTTEGKSYRWVKTTKVSKNKNGKLSWKKVSGAKYYLLKITKNGKTKYKKVTGTSYKAGKGAKVRIRPITKKSKKVYVGAFCKTVKVK